MIVYYSATGTTERIAHLLAEYCRTRAVGLEPAQIYCDADLDWRVQNSRANREQQDPHARPEIAGSLPDLASVHSGEPLLLGFPLWWGIAPRIIDSFLEQADLSGVTVIPFCTSGSSPAEPAMNDLARHHSAITWGIGRRFSRFTHSDAQAWLQANVVN